MGAKKALKKNMQKISASSAAAASSSQVAVPQNLKLWADFLPLEGGPARKTHVTKPLESKATALSVESLMDSMKLRFKQFGTGKITGWESHSSEKAISGFKTRENEFVNEAETNVKLSFCSSSVFVVLIWRMDQRQLSLYRIQ